MPLTYIQAAKKAGYMQKGGEFKKLPKKGTPEYNKIKALMR